MGVPSHGFSCVYSAEVTVSLLTDPDAGLMHPRFWHTFTLAMYDVRSASGLCSYKAHVCSRRCERVSFLGTHDSAHGDIKSETVVVRTPFGV